ncbi:MAG: DUF151 domain-containing protein [Salinivirgaceae bacterium]|nr:DUF151 domain-containing protein [Salinivirgaceae bacterium]
MAQIKLKVLGLSYSQTQSGAYALVLSEEEGNRRIPIIIGGFEAQSIAIELESLRPPRPLTHDLFVNFAQQFEIDLLEVNIYRFEDGIFYSELTCQQGENIVKIDARTSDAVALAIRVGCPIFTNSEIMDKTGILMPNNPNVEQTDNTKSQPSTSEENKYAKVSLRELKELLDKSISNEDYEEASNIRDEIKRREKK